MVQERLIDSGRADPWDVVGTTITQNAVPMIEYTDLNLSYTLGFNDRGRIYLSVTNLFNRDPPVTITVAHQSVDPTSFDVYDVLGRRFFLGYRLSL
jgi:outer membrane receptor protein involved in Fe transport